MSGDVRSGQPSSEVNARKRKDSASGGMQPLFVGVDANPPTRYSKGMPQLGKPCVLCLFTHSGHAKATDDGSMAALEHCTVFDKINTLWASNVTSMELLALADQCAADVSGALLGAAHLATLQLVADVRLAGTRAGHVAQGVVERVVLVGSVRDAPLQAWLGLVAKGVQREQGLVRVVQHRGCGAAGGSEGVRQLGVASARPRAAAAFKPARCAPSASSCRRCWWAS